LLVADPDRQPANVADADLRVRIQERVEQRRQAGQLPRGHDRMSRSSSVNGHSPDIADGPPAATKLAGPAASSDDSPAASSAVPSGVASAVPSGVAPAVPSGVAPAVSSGVAPAVSSGGRHALASRNGALTHGAAVEPDVLAGRGDGSAADRLVGPNGLGSPELLAKRNGLLDRNGVAGRAAVATRPAADPTAARPFRTRQLPAERTGRRRHAAVAAGPGLLGRAIRWMLLLAVTATAVFGLRQYVIASYYIPSASMETTLHGCPGCQPDMVLVDKLSYRFKSVSRSDVVVFARPPQAPPEDKQLIKRVIGLPGDLVSGHDGHVFVDNKELVEPYVDPACHGTADFAAVRVPAGRYFVMGDNRCDSFDSRMFGTIPRSAVIGRAFAVIWPVHHLRWL
jgi:signal peptidase I